ncbi:AEC family transporter [Haloarcula nitratireducens]|uniref:AEC family transporter n=1 Tax=Haloarcula nitratireducens TaxID=2487749 RepID=A0AAW4PDX4_9EURY|nr:AEC family transporter [Halomicroarcula nitratireducens]MBX0295482.1 AEC family transporter [Halomicroarcula nitratireducens]
MSLLGIFASAILPVVAVAAVGFFLGRYEGVDPDALNTVTVYVLAPALVVHSLTTSALGGGTIVQVVLTVFAFTAAMLVVAELVGRFSGYSEPLLGAFVLVSIFPNTGNYGIPLADFAFGPTGRSVAVLVTALQGVMLYTLGIYVAARGSGGDALADMRQVFGVPLVYAVVAALAVRWLGVVPAESSTLMQTLELLGNASIPVMLLILGIQLSSVDGTDAVRPVGTASGLRLLLAPVVATGVALLVGFSNPTVARVVVLLLATPTGVTTLILVGAFSEDAERLAPGEFVSATVLLTTLASVLTVTLLVAALQSGAVL